MDKISSADYKAFILVLMIDRVDKRNLGLRTKSEFLLGILGYLPLLVSGSNLAEPERSILLSYWKSYLALEKKDNAAIEENVVEADAMSVMRPWIDLISIRIWDRRFFISSSKAIGLASQEVIEGDIICIPLGCCHPVVLRKVEDHYINLGETYVDGYMYGEAMGMLEREELKLEDLELSCNKNRLDVSTPPANVSGMFGRKHKFICHTYIPSIRTGTPAIVHQLPHLTHCHLHPPPSFHRCPRITQHYDPDTIPQRQQNL